MKSTADLISLADLNPGDSATIVDFSVTGAARRRLLDLGLLPGVTITAELRAPLGEPVAYRIREALIALRRDQTSHIQVRRHA